MLRLHYTIQNNGDGSASVRLHPSEEAAEEADKYEEEHGEGFAESTASYIHLKIEENKVFYSSFEKIGGKYQSVWVEIKS